MAANVVWGVRNQFFIPHRDLGSRFFARPRAAVFPPDSEPILRLPGERVLHDVESDRRHAPKLN